jgi:hypothetical protein
MNRMTAEGFRFAKMSQKTRGYALTLSRVLYGALNAVLGILPKYI